MDMWPHSACEGDDESDHRPSELKEKAVGSRYLMRARSVGWAAQWCFDMPCPALPDSAVPLFSKAFKMIFNSDENLIILSV